MNDDNGIESDGRIPETSTVSITPFAADQMFQRWLLDRVHQRKEFEFERGTLTPVIGFLTGLDDLNYSVSTSTHPPKSRILPRSTVTLIAETGRSLHELEPEVVVLIKRYTQRIHRAAAEALLPAQRMRPSTTRPSQQTV